MRAFDPGRIPRRPISLSEHEVFHAFPYAFQCRARVVPLCRLAADAARRGPLRCAPARHIQLGWDGTSVRGRRRSEGVDRRADDVAVANLRKAAPPLWV